MGAACSGSKKKQKLVEENPNSVPNPPHQQSPPPKSIHENPPVIEKPHPLLGLK